MSCGTGVVDARTMVAATPRVPLAMIPHAAHRPACDSGTPEHLDGGRPTDKWHQQGEGDERQFDGEAPGQLPDRDVGVGGDPDDDCGVEHERPPLVPGCGDHCTDERDRRRQLAVGGNVVQRSVRVEEQASSVRAAHGDASGRRVLGRAARDRDALAILEMPKAAPNVIVTPMTPAIPVLRPLSWTPFTE